MNRIFRSPLVARGSEDKLMLDGKTSNQKLVRDDVVVSQSHDRDQALRNAIRRVEAERREAAKQDAGRCEDEMHV